MNGRYPHVSGLALSWQSCVVGVVWHRHDGCLTLHCGPTLTVVALRDPLPEGTPGDTGGFLQRGWSFDPRAWAFGVMWAATLTVLCGPLWWQHD
jgi:hypothetical protein